MIQTISNSIKAKLETLKGTWQPLVNVLSYHSQENGWFPFATFELVELIWEIRDTCNNERSLTFDLYVLQNFKSKQSDNTTSVTREQATEILYKAMDTIIDAFDADYTLWWTVELVQPIWWTVLPVNIWNGSALAATIQLIVRYNHFIK